MHARAGPLPLRGLLLFLGLECAMLTLQAFIGSHWGIFVALTLICFSGVWIFESPDRLKQWRPYMEPYVIPIGLALVIFGATIIGLGHGVGMGFSVPLQPIRLRRPHRLTLPSILCSQRLPLILGTSWDPLNQILDQPRLRREKLGARLRLSFLIQDM
jgi:hypothetical protein